MDTFIDTVTSWTDKNSPYYVEEQEHDFVPVKGYKNGIKRIDGVLLPFHARNLTTVKNMDVRADDTFVISYPKSGEE